MIKESTRRLPLTKVIAVDVDDTLVTRGIVNFELIKWCQARREKGFTLILWSQRGERHAKKMAEYANATDVFHYIIGKPGYIVDDQGWSWTKFTQRIKR